MWNKDIPTEEGWYFWCDRRVRDPFYWHTYYVAIINVDPTVTFWENGVEVPPPEKGFWMAISF